MKIGSPQKLSHSQYVYATLQTPAVHTIGVKKGRKLGANISMKMAKSFRMSANNLQNILWASGENIKSHT